MVATGNALFDYLSGEKLYQARARAALPLLVRQATQAHNATIFYSDLAAELGMANERNLNYVLGYIGDALEQLSKQWRPSRRGIRGRVRAAIMVQCRRLATPDPLAVKRVGAENQV